MKTCNMKTCNGIFAFVLFWTVMQMLIVCTVSAQNNNDLDTHETCVKIIINNTRVIDTVVDTSYSSPVSENNTVVIAHTEKPKHLIMIVIGENADVVVQYELTKLVDNGNITGLSFEDISQISLMSKRYSYVYYKGKRTWFFGYEWVGDNSLSCTEIIAEAMSTVETDVMATGSTGTGGVMPDSSEIPEEVIDVEEDMDMEELRKLDESNIEIREDVVEKRGVFVYLRLITVGVIILAICFAVYQIHRSNLEKTNKRIQILGELYEAGKIPTYISQRTGMSKSTVVEYLQRMEREGLVEKEKSFGKKFVYYKLTWKGKEFLKNKGG